MQAQRGDGRDHDEIMLIKMWRTGGDWVERGHSSNGDPCWRGISAFSSVSAVHDDLGIKTV